jgi:hypothetical protein
MTDGEPGLERHEIRLPDGRRLVFYPFPGEAAAGAAPAAQGGAPHAPEERSPARGAGSRGPGEGR